MFGLVVLFMALVVEGVTTDQFSNGLGIENLTYTGTVQNVSRTLRFPRYINVTNASLSLTSYNLTFIDTFTEPNGTVIGNWQNLTYGAVPGWCQVNIRSNETYIVKQTGQSCTGAIERQLNAKNFDLRFNFSLVGSTKNNMFITIYSNYSDISTQMSGLSLYLFGATYHRTDIYFNKTLIDQNNAIYVGHQNYTARFNYNGTALNFKFWNKDSAEFNGWNVSYNLTLNKNNLTGIKFQIGGSADASEPSYLTIDDLRLTNITTAININNSDIFDNDFFDNNTFTNSVYNYTSFLIRNHMECDCDYCSIPTGYEDYCDLKFDFYSDIPGIVEYSNLQVMYNYNFSLTNCSDGLNTYNFTIIDEDNEKRVNANIDSTFYYVLYGESKSLDLDFTSVNNFSVCITPNMAQFTGNYSITYSSATHPQRHYEVTSATYSNNTQTVTLYLLNTTSTSLYVNFRVVDSYDNPLVDVQVTMRSIINGSLVTLQQETTDDAGLATFYADSDKDYQFTFTKQGYETKTYNLRPITSEIITVTMASETSVTHNYAEGVTIYYSPIGLLQNDSYFNFTHNVSSAIWNITACNLTLYNGTTIIDYIGGDFNRTFCNTSLEFDADGYKYITSHLYYVMDNKTFENIIVYAVLYEYTGEGSLKNFLNSLNNFSKAGFDDFSRMILGLLIIVGVIGFVISLEPAFREPESLIIGFLLLLLFFSVQGWFTVNYAPIPTDFAKQYIIFTICGLIGGSYLIRKLVVNR